MEHHYIGDEQHEEHEQSGTVHPGLLEALEQTSRANRYLIEHRRENLLLQEQLLSLTQEANQEVTLQHN